MKPTTTRPSWPPVFVTDDDVRAAEARLCAALGALRTWADEHGDRPAADRVALWRGYHAANAVMLAFGELDARAFGGVE